MTTEIEELTAAYLAELEREASRLPWSTRTELLEDVRSHIEVALAEVREGAAGGGAGVGADIELAQVRAILAALGEPREIVAAALADEPAQPTPPPMSQPSPQPVWPTPPPPPLAISSAIAAPEPAGPPYPLGLSEIFAIVLLLAGGFLFGLGWLVGLLLLWNSPRWSPRDKLLGTFALPGGYAGVLYLLMWPSGFSLPAWIGMPVLFLLLATPLASAIVLFRRARQNPAGIRSSSGRSVGLAVLGVVGGLAFLMSLGIVFFIGSSSNGSGSVNPAQVGPVPSYSDPGSGSGSGVFVESSSR